MRQPVVSCRKRRRESFMLPERFCSRRLSAHHPCRERDGKVRTVVMPAGPQTFATLVRRRSRLGEIRAVGGVLRRRGHTIIPHSLGSWICCDCVGTSSQFAATRNPSTASGLRSEQRLEARQVGGGRAHVPPLRIEAAGKRGPSSTRRILHRRRAWLGRARMSVMRWDWEHHGASTGGIARSRQCHSAAPPPETVAPGRQSLLLHDLAHLAGITHHPEKWRCFGTRPCDQTKCL